MKGDRSIKSRARRRSDRLARPMPYLGKARAMLRRWAYFDQPRTASLPDEQLLHQPPAALGLRLGEPFPPSPYPVDQAPPPPAQPSAEVNPAGPPALGKSGVPPRKSTSVGIPAKKSGFRFAEGEILRRLESPASLLISWARACQGSAYAKNQ